MKRILFLLKSFIIILVLFACQQGENVNTIVVTNSSVLDLTDKPIIITRTGIPNIPEGDLFPLLLKINGDTLPVQADDLNDDGKWDELFFVIDIAAEDSVKLSLQWTETPQTYIKRTSVKFGKRSSKDTPVQPKTSDTLRADEVHAAMGYQPYQTDGPMWENDKIGFRHYFDGRNSKDLFGKKASFMSPESIGIGEGGKVEDNYHVMADWGRDILSVGNSAGIGGFELMIGDSICRLGITGGDTLNNIEESIFSIITEGPVRTVINFQYNNWHAKDRLYDANETVSIWPGMYAYQSEVEIKGLQGDEKLIIGLVNSETDSSLVEVPVDDKYMILYTHDKQTYDSEWWLGLALILPKDIYSGNGEAPETGQFVNSYYGILEPAEDNKITYYSVGCWELSDENFTDRQYFEDYVVGLARELAVEPGVTVK